MLARPAVGAADAEGDAGAFQTAMDVEAGHHQFALLQQMAIDRVIEPVLGFAEEAGETRAIGLATLFLLRVDEVHATILHEVATDGVDGEVDAILRAVVAHTAYPFVVAGAVAAEALAAKVHVLYLPAGEGWRDVYLGKHRREVDALVTGRDVAEEGPPLVERPLRLARHVQIDVLVALTPVLRQALHDARHSLGEDVEDDVRPPSDDAPHLRAPPVGLFQKRVRSHVHPQRIARRYLVPALARHFQRLAEHLGAHNLRARLRHVVRLVEHEHVAELAALALASASMPRVPGFRVGHRCLLVFVEHRLWDRLAALEAVVVLGNLA